jgi:hypothetical protein
VAKHLATCSLCSAASIQQTWLARYLRGAAATQAHPRAARMGAIVQRRTSGLLPLRNGARYRRRHDSVRARPPAAVVAQTPPRRHTRPRSPRIRRHSRRPRSPLPQVHEHRAAARPGTELAPQAPQAAKTVRAAVQAARCRISPYLDQGSALRAPRARGPRRAEPGGGPPVARRVAQAAPADQDRSDGTQAGTAQAVFLATHCPARGHRV